MDRPIVDTLVKQLKDLPRELFPFAGVIAPADAESVCEAIERGCEQVDANE